MSDYLGEPRFRVTEIDGYGETARGNNYTQATSFHIVDRAYCCAEVWSEYAGRGGHGPSWARRFRANAKCADLNAKHDALAAIPAHKYPRGAGRFA